MLIQYIGFGFVTHYQPPAPSPRRTLLAKRTAQMKFIFGNFVLVSFIC